MSDYKQKTKQDIENSNGKDSFEGTLNENRELFKRAISEALDSKFREIPEKTGDIEIPPPSKRHKKRMNRLFRERVGGNFLPFPDVDNFYERTRSKLIVKLKINKFIDRSKEKKREK
ncbi:MAG: hypothetical protein IJW38_04600 [Clostridia bacterium]|nr:hypothetical protein [Clostridia bacterium]